MERPWSYGPAKYMGWSARTVAGKIHPHQNTGWRNPKGCWGNPALLRPRTNHQRADSASAGFGLSTPRVEPLSPTLTRPKHYFSGQPTHAQAGAALLHGVTPEHHRSACPIRGQLTSRYPRAPACPWPTNGHSHCPCPGHRSPRGRAR